MFGKISLDEDEEEFKIKNIETIDETFEEKPKKVQSKKKLDEDDDFELEEKKRVEFDAEEYYQKIKKEDISKLKNAKLFLEKLKKDLVETISTDEVKQKFFITSKKLEIVQREILTRENKKNAYLDEIPKDLEGLKKMKENIEKELKQLPKKTVEVMVLENVLKERYQNVTELLKYLQLSPDEKKKMYAELQNKKLKEETSSPKVKIESSESFKESPKKDSPILKTKTSNDICSCTSSSCSKRHICNSKCPKINDDDHCKDFIHRCPKGKSCHEHKENVEHKLKYLHVCPAKTGTCKFINDPVHLQRFSHECIKSSCSDNDKVHKFMYNH